MSDEGDFLLAALSHWGRARSSTVRTALDFAVSSANVAGANVANERVRKGAIRTIEALGHCLVDRRADVVEVSPPVLARLPARGVPQAVLCGWRTPWFVRNLGIRMRNAGIAASVRMEAQARPLVPRRIVISVESVDEFANLGHAISALSPLDPPSVALVESSGSVEQYEGALEWQREPDINWPRRDFDVERLSFSAARLDDGTRLMEFTDQVRMTTLHYVRRGEETARCDRNWGRYLMLAKARRNVLAYDRKSQRFGVPVTAPLPLLLARALTLCTGLAPRISYASPPFQSASGLGIEAYGGVSPAFAERVASKLSQSLVPMALEVEEVAPSA